MGNEIRRNNWTRFFKRFNSANRYRSSELSIKHNGENDASITMTPFMGICLTKRGRFIDGVQFHVGRWNSESVTEPIITIKDPSQIWLENDKNGRARHLRVRSKDGTEARLELKGDPGTEQVRSLVEKVAYSMFERRGYMHGNDMADWLEAEDLVREAETQLTQ